VAERLAPLDSRPGGSEFESRSDHWLDLFLGIPEFNSSATFANSQLDCLTPAGVLNFFMFNLIICFLITSVKCL